MADLLAVTPGDITVAADRIRGRVRRTPVVDVSPGLVLKLELLQHTGSFKARGAFNRLLSAAAAGDLTSAGVLAASGGNAGLAVAYAARELGVPARILVPRTAPEPKVRRLRGLQADVVQVGDHYAEAAVAAESAASASGALLVHATAPRSRTRRCAVAVTPPQPVSGWFSCCAVRTPIRPAWRGRPGVDVVGDGMTYMRSPRPRWPPAEEAR